MSAEQQAMVDGILRGSAFPVGSTVQEQRQLSAIEVAMVEEIVGVVINGQLRQD